MSAESRGRRTVVILTLVTTIAAALVAGLDVEAGIHADKASRESDRLVIAASSLQISDAKSQGFENRLVTDVLAATQEGLTMSAAALERAGAGDADGARHLTALADAQQARADTTRGLSAIYSDPRFGTDSQDELPDVTGYFSEKADAEAALVARQNQASDTLHEWESRSDTYVAILSVLAITFFLLGLAQVSGRMRRFLAWCAGSLLVLSLAWTAFTVAS